MLLPVFLISFYLLEISGSTLHHRLTTRELFHLFGSSSVHEVPDYGVVYLRQHSREKRSLLPNDHLLYQLHLEGKNVTLHLQPNRNLVSPYFELKPDGLDVNISQASDCLYHGRVLSRSGGRAAVSTCAGNGLSGMIETSQGRYQIHPVPAHLQENVADQGYMHVLVPKNETGTFCGVHELNTPQKLMKASISESANVRRSRRSEAPPDKLYIETAVFADYMLYRTLVGKGLLPDHDAFVKYVLAIVNTVQLIYNEVSIGKSVEIVLVRLEILQNEHLPFYNEEVDKYLWDFCKWQSGLNPGSDISTPKHWDHAIILTGFDLRSGNMRSVTGYAPVGGMCNPMYSCTINEGNHFGAAFVIAHEMGHSLTMQHDGQAGISGNGCDAQSFLMSPSTGRGKTTWSTCSKDYLDIFLGSSQSSCLKDVPPGRESAIDFNSGNLPGQVYPPDDQCRLLYGVEFHRYNMQPDQDVCEILICANSTVYITGHPALPGTFCGQGHWCSAGACVPWGTHGPIPIDGGWSGWPSSADCTANCVLPGTGLRIFGRGCTNPLPANGGKQCEGKSKRYRTCDQAAMCDSQKIMTINDYSNKQCLTTKTVQSDLTLTGTGRQRLQDPTGGCVIWCDTVQGGYKTWGNKFPDGTDCSAGKARAFCVEGQCKPFGCDGWTMDESAPGSCKTAQEALPTKPSVIQSQIDVFKVPAIYTLGVPVLRLEMPKNSSEGDKGEASKNLLFPDEDPFYAAIPQPWSPWENIGPCISSCLQNSTGLRKVARKCMDASGVCLGRNVSVLECPATCPNVFFTASMYVTKICSALRTIDPVLTGSGKQLPHSPEDPQQGCKLWCEKEETLRSWPDMYFPDGTLCGSDKLTSSFCLKGICTAFGCDGKPVGESDFRKCDLPSDGKFLGSKNVMVNGKPSMTQHRETGRIPFSNTNGSAGYQWTVVSTSCSKSCDGGTRKNFVQCAQVMGNMPAKLQQKSDESNCAANPKPEIVMEESCNTQACPQWSYSSWKPCSASCGNATQTRLVQCVQQSPPVGNVTVETILEDSRCDIHKKPDLAQLCSLPPCPATDFRFL